MKLSRKIGAVLGVTVGVVLLSVGSAAAQTFNENHIIDDAIFNSYTTMDANAIDGFLNNFPGSCISSNNGFTSPDVTGYSPSTGFTYGGNVSAGTVIAHAAQAYNINPQVLLSTMQKEQSLVSGSAGCHANNPDPSWPSSGSPSSGHTFSCTISGQSATCTYACPFSGGCINIATGYGCPNYCNTADEGFSKQIIHAAWLLAFAEHRSEGQISWNVQLTTTRDLAGNAWNSSWDNSDDPQTCYGGPMTQGSFQTCPSGPTVQYDGCRSIGGATVKNPECNNSTDVHMDTGSTAALYYYTPFISGNQNFFNIFTGWFGPTTTAGYSYSLLGHDIYTDSSATTEQNSANLVAGQRYYAVVTVQNTGEATWYRDQVNLGTSKPQDRPSIIKDWTWPSPSNNRAAFFSQGDVVPGGDATYGFWFVAPPASSIMDWEHFNLVVEGITWMPDQGIVFGLQSHPPTYSYSLLGHDLFTSSSMATEQNASNLTPGQRYFALVKVRNTGNTIWYAGQTNIGTWDPKDRPSRVKDWTWPSPNNNRAGTIQESSIPPGDTGTFEFWLVAPKTMDWEHFNLVVEGITWMPDQGIVFGLK